MKPSLLHGDSSWPSSIEFKQVGEIRNACLKELSDLPCVSRDVTGDLRICRFLRFHSGNLKKAIEGYRAFLRFRIENKLDNLRKDVIDLPLAEFAEWLEEVRSPYAPHMTVLLGETPDGHLLSFGQPGYFKAVDFVKKRPACHTLDTDLLIAWLCAERVLKHLDDRSYELNRMLYVVKIMDFQNFGKEKIPIFVPEVRKWAQTNMPPIMQHYCEHDILILVVNAPLAFRMVFAFMSTLMSKRQVGRVKVFANTTSVEAQAALSSLGAPETLVGLTQGRRPLKPVPLLHPFAWEDDARVQKFLARREAPFSAENPPVFKGATTQPDEPPQQPAAWKVEVAPTPQVVQIAAPSPEVVATPPVDAARQVEGPPAVEHVVENEPPVVPRSMFGCCN
mmetsp:Transcript_29312/g.67479  ORF Transcript_29312/g.67479 Transcript_29312/m.67479 type:complete len:392 (+) Transcript_29312:77-1252(+)